MNDRQEPGLLHKTLRTTDAFVRALANGLTFGLADYLAGAGDHYIYDSAGAGGDLRQKIATQQAMTHANGSAINAAGNITGSAITGAVIGSAFTGVKALTSLRAIRIEAAMKKAGLPVPATVTQQADTGLKTVLAGEAGMAGMLLMDRAGKDVLDTAFGIETPHAPDIRAAEERTR